MNINSLMFLKLKRSRAFSYFCAEFGVFFEDFHD